MADTWFRFYNEAVDDPKVQRLPLILFRAWVNCLCLASKNGGILPNLDEISYKLRVTRVRAEWVVEELKTANLIDLLPCGDLQMHNWKGRQFKSDGSKERTQRYRERHRDVTETVDVTDQRQNRTDTEQKEPPICPLSGGNGLDGPKLLCDIWNQERGGLPECKRLTPERRKKALVRWQAHENELDSFQDAFRASVRKAGQSVFLCGGGRTGWRATFDWFIKNNTNYIKVLEGRYDGTGQEESRAEAVQRRTQEHSNQLRRFVDGEASGGVSSGNHRGDPSDVSSGPLRLAVKFT
jgi:hypothetical protein